MPELSLENSVVRSEESSLETTAVVGAPNGAHRWIRLAGLAGAMGNGMGQGLLDEVGSWASTPFWRRDAVLEPAPTELLVRRDGASILVVRAPADYQRDPLVVDILFEHAGATTCAPYEVVTAADADYALYLALLHDRKGEDWAHLQPALVERARVALGVEVPAGWEEKADGGDLWGGQDGMTQMAGLTPGPWDPPGKQPIPLYVGREVHDVIAQEYVAARRGEQVFTNNSPLNSILKSCPGAALNKLSEQERLLKPDIANLTRLHLYEIKSEAEASAGAAKLATYLGAFQAAGVPMEAGPMAEPGTQGVLPAPAGFVLYHCLMPGLIVYRYRRALPEPVPLPVGVPAPESAREPVRSVTDWRYWEELTGLTGAALVLYLLVSEGSRLFPARNAIPVP